MGAIDAARGQYIVMGDSDDSYDFTDLLPFVEKLRQGCDLVMGNRFRGGIKPGAMPFLNRYLGNPVLSSLGRLFFRVSVGDFHIPHLVSWNLAGEPRADDARMLELLHPYRGQRGRVIRLLEAGGRRPPRFGPRLELRSIARI